MIKIIVVALALLISAPALAYAGAYTMNGEIKAARICEGSNPLACIP